jgi:phosphocarrier protein HPr
MPPTAKRAGHSLKLTFIAISRDATMIVATLSARRRAVITNAFGLHLRPAARFAELAQRFAAEVRVRSAGAVADGKSLLDLIGLAAGDGTVLELEAHGPDAEEAVIALAGLISARFHEADASQVA